MTEQQTASLFARLKRTKRLPSPPGTVLRVLELCRSDDTDVRKITEAVMADPALSVRLLRYANSAAVGASHEVASVRDAVLHLGLRTVKLAALGFSLASSVETHCAGLSLKRFWTESIVRATLARRFASYFGADREEAFTAGLLAGIGRLALASALPEEYGAVAAAAAGREPEALIQAERDHLGTDHIAFAGQLLTEWGLPNRLAQAVVQQQQPHQAEGRARPLAQALAAAALLAPLFLQDREFPPKLQHAARDVIENTLRLTEEAWQQVAQETLADYQQAAEVFDVELDPASVFDLYAEAQEEATRVGIVTQLEKTRALEENKDLLKRATTDALTGIANRARFESRLGELIAGLARQHGDFALLLLDIDSFKQFNDNYGHATGDLVLKQVAQTLLRILRDVDLLARYGGEEFVILAPQTDQRGACVIAARARKAIENMEVKAFGAPLRVTASVGLVVSSDYPAIPTAEQLLADVDRQMYLSKQAGRNTWSYRDRTASRLTTVGQGGLP